MSSKKHLFDGLLEGINPPKQNTNEQEPEKQGKQENIKKVKNKTKKQENQFLVKTEKHKKVKQERNENVNMYIQETASIKEETEKKTFEIPTNTAIRLKIASALLDKFEKEIVDKALNQYLDNIGIPKEMNFEK